MLLEIEIRNRKWKSLRKKSYRNDAEFVCGKIESGKETGKNSENVCGYVA